MSETNAGKMRWYAGLTKYHYLVLTVACLGWSFDTMDQWLFVFSKQHAITSLLGEAGTPELVAWYNGLLTAIMMIGWATGGLVFGMYGDRLGRTKTMALTILIYAGFTGLSAFSWDIFSFATFRFLTGLGIGGEFAAGAALVAESLPAHSRPTALGVVQGTSALGNIGAGLINLGMSSHMSTDTAWRWMFAVGFLPALLVAVIIFFISEPEQWKHARARANEGKERVGSMGDLFRDPVIRRNTLVALTLASVGVIGFWGIGTWTPELYRAVFNPENDPALKAMVEKQVSYVGMAQNFGGFFGAICFAWIAQAIGRRPAFAVALLSCLVVIPITVFFTDTFAKAIVLFFCLGFVLLLLLGGFAVYFPELFPTRLRSTGTGFCYNVARFVTAAGVLVSGSLAKNFGYVNSALLMCGIFIIGLMVLPLAPETRNKPLPE
ncbi:MAG: MFS transporter [Candidatus Hydrogenedentes bacterium]|nr:MFS transporter [Candidatus Hydrogenedentota bacterium]